MVFGTLLGRPQIFHIFNVLSPRDKNPEDTSRKDVADDEGVDGHLKPILCTALALHEFKGKEGTKLRPDRAACSIAT